MALTQCRYFGSLNPTRLNSDSIRSLFDDNTTYEVKARGSSESFFATGKELCSKIEEFGVENHKGEIRGPVTDKNETLFPA